MLSHMKRTTLLLDAALYADLKRRAAAEGRTLTEVVEQALRLGIHARDSIRRGRLRLPSYDLGPFLVSPAERAAAPSAEPEGLEEEP
jgi:ribbon-helix-helix CopG family protein